MNRRFSKPVRGCVSGIKSQTCLIAVRPVSTDVRRAAIQERIALMDSSSASTNGVLSSPALTDSFRRGHSQLRISLTEKCNLRCTYCMPAEGVELSPKEDLLSTPEVIQLARLLVQQGITKIRLTGGEPTIRTDLVDIIRELSQTPGLDFIGMTTNGIALHRKLPALIQAGLNNINLSLDTLDEHKFELMTRRRGHSAVLRALDVALAHLPPPGTPPIPKQHLTSVKLNAVVIRGVNDQEVLDFVQLARTKRVDVRFIEYMPFDDNRWHTRKLVPSKELLERAQVVHPDLHPVQGHQSDTSRIWTGVNWPGSVGFISSMTDHFCGGCSRLRLGADGAFKVCLFGPPKLNLRDLLRAGATEPELLQHISTAVKGKHFAHDGKSNPSALARSQNAPMVKIARSYPQCLQTLHPAKPWLFMAGASNQIRWKHTKATANRRLTHVDDEGNAHMVDVSEKTPTTRTATAIGRIYLEQEAWCLLNGSLNKKGSPLAVAQLAGIMAAKRTSELIPLCHPLPLSSVKVDLKPVEGTPPRVDVTASVKTTGVTGVEMEALTAVSVACLTVHDMVKSAGQREMRIEGIRVVSKQGGKSGSWHVGNKQTANEEGS